MAPIEENFYCGFLSWCYQKIFNQKTNYFRIYRLIILAPTLPEMFM